MLLRLKRLKSVNVKPDLSVDDFSLMDRAAEVIRQTMFHTGLKVKL
jgi:hypothetical protein